MWSMANWYCFLSSASSRFSQTSTSMSRVMTCSGSRPWRDRPSPRPARRGTRPRRRRGLRPEVRPAIAPAIIAEDRGGERIALQHALPKAVGELVDSGVRIAGDGYGGLGLRCRTLLQRGSTVRPPLLGSWSPEDVGEQRGRRLRELIVATVGRRSIRPPAAEGCRVTEAIALEVVEGDLADRAPGRTGSQERSLPRFQREVAPGMRFPAPTSITFYISFHSCHGWPSTASRRYGFRKSTSSARLAAVNEEVTPTCRRLPGVVPEAEQQRPDERSRPVLVPSEAGDHAIRGAQSASPSPSSRLPGRYVPLRPLGDDPVEARPLELVEPAQRASTAPSDIARREQDRWRRHPPRRAAREGRAARRAARRAGHR